MEVVASLQKYFFQSSLAFMKTVPIGTLKLDKRAKYMCKFGCKNYNRKYSCPPVSVGLYERIGKHYKWAILFATTSRVEAEYSSYRIKALNRQKEFEIQRISSQIAKILESHGINHFLLSGGSCKQCRECSLINDEACRKPAMKQTSMEAVGIDCQKTMNIAGFDFQMPNNGSINRCGCILTNEDQLSHIYLNGHESYQKFKIPSYQETLNMSSILSNQYSYLFGNVQVVSLANIPKENHICDACDIWGRNFACPPYAEKIDTDLWSLSILWKWKTNSKKKTTYNIALKTIHSAFFSLGYYFALSLRDCFCDECNPCSYLESEKPVCLSRKLLSPSMQSQGINPKEFGEGRFGLELI